MAHVTIWPRGQFSGTGTESLTEHGIEAGTGNDVTGPEMTSWVARSGIGAEEIT